MTGACHPAVHFRIAANEEEWLCVPPVRQML